MTRTTLTESHKPIIWRQTKEQPINERWKSINCQVTLICKIQDNLQGTTLRQHGGAKVFPSDFESGKAAAQVLEDGLISLLFLDLRASSPSPRLAPASVVSPQWSAQRAPPVRRPNRALGGHLASSEIITWLVPDVFNLKFSTVPLISCEKNNSFRDCNNVLFTVVVFGLEDASWSGGGLKPSARFGFSAFWIILL